MRLKRSNLDLSLFHHGNITTGITSPVERKKPEFQPAMEWRLILVSFLSILRPAQ